MAKVRAARRARADEATMPLFQDLPEPPSVADIVELRNLRHPVWTEQKARLIATYLRLFTFVTKHGTYIDGFAGRQNAKAKDGWAAELVLANRPPWLRRFYLCDKDASKIKGLYSLANRQPAREKGDPQRNIEILPGDFNDTVRGILATKKLDPATFCLLDQRTFECKWSTVEALANHRPDGSRIELFYFLPIGWIDRAIEATTKHLEEIDTWWGDKNWRALRQMQHHEKALVFQKKFQDLGYHYVVPFPIWDHQYGDRLMFYMILATDHPAAPKLMWRAYDKGCSNESGWDQLPLQLLLPDGAAA